MQRQGIARAAVIPVRRDDDDVRDIREGVREGDDAPLKVAVVVTDQDFHVSYCSG